MAHGCCMKVYGYNSVVEALKAGKVGKLYVSRSTNPKILKVIEKARRMGIPVYTVKNLPGNEKIAADVSPIKYVDSDLIIEKALRENKFILILDNVQDPQNLGACIRTAEFFGCAGVIIPKRRAAQVTGSVIKASAGAAFHINIAREENFASFAKKLKKYGFYLVGAEVDGEDILKVDLSPPVTIALGGEDKGISAPLRKQCDVIIKIPGFGKVGSLNLSVAAGILMYESMRRALKNLVKK